MTSTCPGGHSSIACTCVWPRLGAFGPNLSSRDGMKRMVKASPTMRDCVVRSGLTSCMNMLRRLRLCRIPVSVDVPTLSSAFLVDFK